MPVRETNRWLAVAASAEAATGLALILFPVVVGQLLLDIQLVGEAILVARVAGIALVALAIACWPGPPLVGMLLYSTGVAVYLASLSLVEGLTGYFLWPAVVLHAVLSIQLMRVWARR